MIKKIGPIFWVLLCFICFVSLSGCRTSEETSDTADYICDVQNFRKALQLGQKTIYVGDISFETQTEIKLNYSVNIVGKSEKSVIENVHFAIVGANLELESIDIGLSHIIFDGKADKNAIVLEEGKTFGQITSDLPQYRCIDGCIGYYSLRLNHCEIKNYLCEEGPAIYINNDANYREGKKALFLTDTKFYGNVSHFGTVRVFNDYLTTTVSRCEFFGNLARAGQGLSVVNGKSEITDTVVHDNEYFRFFDEKEQTDAVQYHDDKQTNTKKNITTDNLGNCWGTVFIGGSNTVMDGCSVYNNKTTFGGGLGINNDDAIHDKIEIKNTNIQNNTAVRCGGAIYLKSNQGETTSFVNCFVTGNRAGEKGSILYTTTKAPAKWWDEKSGGNVEFLFCTMANNGATDTGTFGFYNLLNPDLAGVITLKGCFVLDNCDYPCDADDYNYIAAQERAVADGVVTETALACVDEKGLSPQKGSIGDIRVTADVYTSWSALYKGATEEKGIGYSTALPSDGEKTFPYWVLVFPIVAVAVAVFAILRFEKKKKKSLSKNKQPIKEVQSAEETVASGSEGERASTVAPNVEQNPPVAEIKKPTVDYSGHGYERLFTEVDKVFGDILTPRERTVATYLLLDKSRKEIAQILIISEETVKTHLSNIFKKIGVSSKAEFKNITDGKFFIE